MGLITEQDSSSLPTADGDVNSIVFREDKITQSKLLGSVREELWLGGKHVQQQKPKKSILPLGDISVENIQSTFSRLQTQNIKLEDVSKEVENPLISCRRTLELCVDNSQVVLSNSVTAHGSESSPTQTYAHTGLTRELEELKISDGSCVEGLAKHDHLNGNYTEVLKNQKNGDEWSKDNIKGTTDFAEINDYTPKF